MDIGKLVAELSLKTDGFNRGVKSAMSGFKSLGSSVMYLNQGVDLMSRAWRGASAILEHTAGSFIKAADTSEKYRLTLNTLLGSQKESARLFQDMSKFAASVPFEYEKIMDGAVQLAGVMEGGVDEIKQCPDSPLRKPQGRLSGCIVPGRLRLTYSVKEASRPCWGLPLAFSIRPRKPEISC
jgi:hypothetical protein